MEKLNFGNKIIPQNVKNFWHGFGITYYDQLCSNLRKSHKIYPFRTNLQLFSQFLAFFTTWPNLEKIYTSGLNLKFMCQFLQLIPKDVLKFKITGHDILSKFCFLKYYIVQRIVCRALFICRTSRTSHSLEVYVVSGMHSRVLRARGSREADLCHAWISFFTSTVCSFFGNFLPKDPIIKNS